MKARVPIAGTVGKSISFDPRAGARAEAAVAALAAQLSAGLGGNIRHSSLQGLQIGDDHPQYTGNAFPETVTGQWNFATIPFIQGETLAEYIEDVVGGSFFDFLQDTTSVVWTYFDTVQHLEANVPPEFVQDTIGAILTDTASIDLVYNDGANTISANIIDEYVQDLVGAMLADSTSIDFTYHDSIGTFTADVLPGGVNHNALANLTVGDPHTQYALDSDLASYVPITRTLTAGAGLTGGGDLSANRSFAIDYAAAATWTAAHIFSGTSARITTTKTSSTTGFGAWYVENDAANAIRLALAGSANVTAFTTNGPTGPAAYLYTTSTNMPISIGTNGIERMRVSDTQITHAASVTSIFNAEVRNQAANPFYTLYDATGATRQGYFGYISSTGYFAIEANSPLNFRTNNIDRLTITAAGNTQLVTDNYELQLGTSQDLRLFHDGTDSWVRNDTGILKLAAGATSIFEVVAARGTFNVPFRSKAYTVATLPAGAQGDRAHVTDALAPAFLTAVVGGGAVVAPVFHNGANWVAN